MIENGLILTGNDAELLSNALAEVKTKVYEESKTSPDDTQALDALLSSLRTVETDEREKERRHAYFSPLRKRLVLGTLVGRPSGAELGNRKNSLRRARLHTRLADLGHQTTGILPSY